MWTYIKLFLLGSVIAILSNYYRMKDLKEEKKMANSRRLSGEDINLYEVLELDKGIQPYSKTACNFYPSIY